MSAKLLRISSILCGLCYTSIAWVWTYYFSLFVLPLGIFGLVLWFLSNKIDDSPVKRTKLERAALYSNLLGFAVSVLSLFGWMVLAR